MMMSDQVGLVELTPDLLEKISESLSARFADIEDRYPKLVEACPYEMKLAVAAWVIKNIVDHATGGGSFRYLIYDRLGFETDAYVPLYQAGGMTISNEFVISEANAEDASLSERLMKALWPERDGRPITFKGGEEPWLTVCQVTGRLTELSHALATEREKRTRLEDELAAAQKQR